MKKILALILMAALVLTMTACGGSDASTEETIKIGMITDTNGINDQSFNQTTWAGLTELAENDPTFEISYLVSGTAADYDTHIQTFLDEEYDLILCTGFKLADATRKAALENPDQLFAIIDDASCADLPNVACLMFAQEQASYLVGVAAALMTETNTVGYVQGMVSNDMNLFGIGFISGVLATNPEATVLQYNANSFGDAAAGAAAVKNFVTKGADIVYHAAGATGAGVITGCQENGIYAIGVDTDQSYLAPETVLTSALKRVDNAAKDVAMAVKNGSFEGGIMKYDISNGGVDIAPTQDLLSEEAIEAIEAAKAALLDGSIVVPTSAEECPAFTLS